MNLNPELYVAIKSSYLRPTENRSAASTSSTATTAAAAKEPEIKVSTNIEGATEGAMDVVATSDNNDNNVDNNDGNDDATNTNKRKRDDRDDPHKVEFKKLTLKARHQHKTRPNKEDRLCPAVIRNEKCTFGDSCYYNHDVADFLSRKPADITNRCYLYDTYGQCPYGFMCRFGDAHIDRVTLTNMTRDTSEGGVLPREPELNPLRKEVQFLLRKKNAYFDDLKKKKKALVKSHAPADTAGHATQPASETAAQPTQDESTASAPASTTTEPTSDVVPETTATSTAPETSTSAPSTATASATASVATHNHFPDYAQNTPALNKILYHNPYYRHHFTPSDVSSSGVSPADVSHSDVSHSDVSYNLSAYPDKPVKLVDFREKVYIAPLTTVGNLPFRRILKDYGADITCGEMSMAFNLQCGQPSEWALLRRHVSEDVFGLQVAGNSSDLLGKCAQLLEQETVSEFVDLNCGCPIDVVCNRGGGSSLLTKPQKLIEILQTMAVNLPSRSLTVKVRTGWDEKHPTTHKLIPQLQKASLYAQQKGAMTGQDTGDLLSSRLACVFMHGRSRLQRYSKLANWDYIAQCARAQDPSLGHRLLPVIGNGDLFSYHDWVGHQQLMIQSAENLGRLAAQGLRNGSEAAVVQDAVGDFAEEWQGDSNHSTLLGLTSCAMLGRGALIKPWLPKEIKEMRDYDISASERMDMLQRFCNYGLDHWGSDSQGVQTTRRFLLEWLSFLHRYVPQGITERPQRMNQRPPPYVGRGEIETLLGSSSAEDWIKLSEYFLGKVPEDYHFQPKHKSNSYASETAANISTGEDIEASNG